MHKISYTRMIYSYSSSQWWAQISYKTVNNAVGIGHISMIPYAEIWRPNIRIIYPLANLTNFNVSHLFARSIEKISANFFGPTHFQSWLVVFSEDEEWFERNKKSGTRCSVLRLLHIGLDPWVKSIKEIDPASIRSISWNRFLSLDILCNEFQFSASKNLGKRFSVEPIKM